MGEFCSRPPGCLADSLEEEIKELKQELQFLKNMIMELVKKTAEINGRSRFSLDCVTRRELYLLIGATGTAASVIAAVIGRFVK